MGGTSSSANGAAKTGHKEALLSGMSRTAGERLSSGSGSSGGDAFPGGGDGPGPEMRTSVFTAEEQQQRIPWCDLMNIIKAFIGSNYIAMPYAFRQGGLTAASIGLVIIAWVTGYCCNLLVLCKRKVELSEPMVQTYGDVAFFVWGRVGRLITDAALTVTQFGFCVGYIVFLSENIVAIVPALTKIEATLVVLPVFLYCCFLRSLRKLLPVSFLANIAILIGYFLVMRVAIVDVADHGPNPSGLEDTVRTSSLPLFFGLVTSSYEGIGLILPVEGSIKKGRQHFTLLLSLAIVIVSCILGSFGLLGFLTYGNQTCSIILLNLVGSTFVDTVKGLVCLGVLFTYPMQIVPVIEILEQRLLGFYGHALEAGGDGAHGHGHGAGGLGMPAQEPRGGDTENPRTAEVKPLLGASVAPTTSGRHSPDSPDVGAAVLAVPTSPRVTSPLASKQARKEERARKRQEMLNREPPAPGTRRRDAESRRSSFSVGKPGEDILPGPRRAAKAAWRPSCVTGEQWMELRRNILRPCCVLLTAFVATLVPNFGLFSSLVGSLGCAFLAFILPVMLHYALFKGEGVSWPRLVLSIAIFVFGVCGAVIGVTVTIEDLITSSGGCT